MLSPNQMPTLDTKGELWQHKHQNVPLLVRMVRVPNLTLFRCEYSSGTPASWKDWVSAGQFEDWIHDGLWAKVVDPASGSHETPVKLTVIVLKRRGQ